MSKEEHSLDPSDWPAFRTLAHRMLDTALDHVQGVEEGPVWSPTPEDVKKALNEPIPMKT
jgi:aromatic-L-amino-acid decarboxylase